jgi:tetratricopeptide (TPR) repeat protein
MTRSIDRVSTWLAIVAVGGVLSVVPIAAQPEGEAWRQEFLRTYDVIEASKGRLATTMMGFVADLEGTDGNEGYRLRAALDVMESSLAEWDAGVGTLERLTGSLGTAGARLVLAQVLLDRHRIDDARRECQRAIELEPTRPDGHALLARIHRAQALPGLAADALRKATVGDASDPLNLYQLASSYEAMGRSAEAAAALEAFVEAAERRLEVLWRAPVLPLSDSVRSGLLDARSRFDTRQAPVDLLARLGGGLAGFLPTSYESAATYFMAGEYPQALAALGDTLDGDPLTRDVPDLDRRDNSEEQLQTARRAAAAPSADAAAFVSLGHILTALEQPEEARQAFARALELDGTLEMPRLRLASHALSQMNGNAAFEQLEIAARQHPASSEVHRLLGNIFLAADNIDAAVTQYRGALVLDPADERLRMSLQTTLLLVEPDETVEAEIVAAVAALPEAGLARQNLGRFYQSVGRYPEALAAYREALERYPVVASGRLHLTIGEILTQQLEVDKAVESFRDALVFDPNNVIPRSWVARLLLEGSRLDEANLEYLVILLLDPLHTEAQVGVAQIELQRGHLARAVSVARRAVTETPDHTQARYTLGQALIRSGDVDAGRTELAEYARLQTNSAEGERRQREVSALNQEALALVGAGQLGQALELLRKAADIDPSGATHTNLGLALMDAGEFAKAIESFEMAAAAAVDSEDIQLYLADAYQEVGRLEESQRARARYEDLTAERSQRPGR